MSYFSRLTHPWIQHSLLDPLATELLQPISPYTLFSSSPNPPSIKAIHSQHTISFTPLNLSQQKIPLTPFKALLDVKNSINYSYFLLCFPLKNKQAAGKVSGNLCALRNVIFPTVLCRTRQFTSAYAMNHSWDYNANYRHFTLFDKFYTIAPLNLSLLMLLISLILNRPQTWFPVTFISDFTLTPYGKNLGKVLFLKDKVASIRFLFDTSYLSWGKWRLNIISWNLRFRLKLRRRSSNTR